MGVGPLSTFGVSGALVAHLGRWRDAFARLLKSLTLGALGKTALEERDRWPLWLAPGLGLGIGVYFALPVEPPVWLAMLGLGVAIAAVLAATRLAHPAAIAALAMLAATSLGFSVANFRTETLSHVVLVKKVAFAGLTARVESVEQHRNGVRAILAQVAPDRAGRELPDRVRLFFRTAPPGMQPGSWISARASLMPPPAPAMPGDYDFGRWAYYEGIGAVGFSFGAPKLIAPRAPDSWRDRWNIGLERLRNAMTARVRAVLPGSEGGISAAMITGMRGGIDPDDQLAYRDSGLVHVLSISGLHLALAGGFFFWIVRALLAAVPAVALYYPIKKWAAVAALFGSAFYLLVSGCEAPALRSYIMLAMMFLAILADRPALSMRSVMWAASLILLWAPESLTQPGFQMSFAAVIGLIAVAEWTEKRQTAADGSRRGTMRRIWRYLVGIIIASLVATLATAPFAIFHFDRSSQYGALSNLISLPIADFVIMPAATLAMIAMPFGLDRWPLLLMGQGVELMTAVAHWVAQMPGAASMAMGWPDYALVIVAAGGLWIAFWRRRWRWLGLVPVCLGLTAALTTSGPDLLVAPDGRTVAMRLPNGHLGFVRPPIEKFAADVWLRRDGDGRAALSAVAGPEQGVSCDELGCVGTLRSGQMVASVVHAEALAEDCASVTVLVSAIPVRGACGAEVVIDRFALLRNGAHAVWLGQAPVVRSVEEMRGLRPWSKPARGQ